MRRAAGFTLIEVMLAVAIMGVAVVALLLIQTEALRVGGDADRLRTLGILAAQKVQDLAESPQESGSGRFSAPHDAYRFTITTTDENWKTPSSEEMGTNQSLVEELALKKRILTVIAPDGQMKVEITSYTFPHEETEPEAGSGAGGEGGGEGEGEGG